MYPCRYEKSNLFGILLSIMNIILFGDELYFPRNDSRYQHIKKILKKKLGDTFSAGIINGCEGRATITRFDDEGLAFDFHSELPMRPLYPVYVIIGFPRPIQLKRLLREISSLGVAAVYLTGTDLGEKSYRESTLVDRGAAYESLIEGCTQAGGTAIPALEMFDSVTDVITTVTASAGASPAGICTSGAQCVLLDTVNPDCSLFNAPFAAISARHPLVLAIGSERGWSASERVQFREAGFMVCSMGARILRTETAATVAVALTLAKTGYMEGME